MAGKNCADVKPELKKAKGKAKALPAAAPPLPKKGKKK
jgi:hypothetical protein